MLFQAEINDRDKAVLYALKEELAIKSNPELLAHLLVIAEWMVEEIRAGRKIVSYSDETPVRELVDPVLKRAARPQQLPRVTIDWTEDELRDLASLVTEEAPSPAPALARAMR